MLTCHGDLLVLYGLDCPAGLVNNDLGLMGFTKQATQVHPSGCRHRKLAAAATFANTFVQPVSSLAKSRQRLQRPITRLS